jgi:hypothetical protein
MDDNQQNQGFEIPQSFLLQLEEYTQGYMLIGCNELGEVYVHESYDNPVIRLGLINFANLHISAGLKHLQNIALKEEEQLSEDAFYQDSKFEEKDEDDDQDEEEESDFK